VPAPPTGRSSAKRKPPTPTTAEILDSVLTLGGRCNIKKQAFNAYRTDLADIALAGRVVASHYAEPLHRHITRATWLFADPSGHGQILCELTAGEPFEMLDNSVGWAWGYAGSDRRVGYVKSGFVAVQLQPSS